MSLLRKLSIKFVTAVILSGLIYFNSSVCLAGRIEDRSVSSGNSGAANALQETGLKARMASPWLGMMVADFPQSSTLQGSVVKSVLANSPALKAGILVGDIIIRLDGKAVTNSKTLTQVIAGLKVGLSYPITVLRNEKTVKLTIRPDTLTVGHFGSASSDVTEEVSDTPAPKKGPLDINVLKYAFIVPETGIVTFVGKYDPAYNTGPIPYADYLSVALENPYPLFSLDPTEETWESLKQADKIIKADIIKMEDPEYANQWTKKVADLLLSNSPSLEADNKRFFSHCAEAIGITGDELKRMHDAATGKINIPDTEVMGLASKMVSGIGLTKAGEALGVLSSGGTPEQLMRSMANKLGLSSQYNQLILKGLDPAEFRKEEIILVISEICRHFEAPENKIQNLVASIRAGQSADILIDYMGKQLSDYIANKSGKKMINGLILGPAIISKIYKLPPFKVKLTFYNLPADSLLGDVFFKSDYRLKSLCTFPEARKKVPAHLTENEFMQKEMPADINKRFCGAGAYTGKRLIPTEVTMQVSPSGDIVEFGKSRIKIISWINKTIGELDQETVNFLSRTMSKYADYLTEHYDQYAKVYPEWHKLSEAAKVIALARWAKSNGYTLKTTGESRIKVNQPASVNGFYSAVFEVNDNNQSLTFIQEGGASFAKEEGEDWLNVQQDVSVTNDTLKQLAASAVFAQQALESAISGDLESARALAEKSAQAMTGEIDLTRLPSLETLPMPAPTEVSSYAAVTSEAINEATDCFQKMSAAGKDIERAEQSVTTSPEESKKLKQQAIQIQEEAKEKLNQILNKIKSYGSGSSRSGEALVTLQSGSAGIAPIGSSAYSEPTGTTGEIPRTTKTASTATKSEGWNKLVEELDEVNKQIASTRQVLLRLNRYTQTNQNLFEEWEKASSEGLDRCVGMAGDVALDFGISGLTERYETIYDLAKKLPDKPEETIEKYRYLSSLTQRLAEAKAVNDVAGLAEKEGKTESELWEILRDGIGQISGLLSLDKTVPGKWWKYGSLAVDTAYNLTELRLIWKNLKVLEENNQKYAEAVQKLSARMKELVERQKEIRQKIEAGGSVENIIK